MNPAIAINAIWTCVFVIGLTYLIFWRLRALAVDWFRDKMFQLRDDFFDASSNGLIDFNHPAYGMLRSTMNGYIRFCHKFSLLNVLLLAIVLPRTESDAGLFRQNWSMVTKDLTSKPRKALEEFRERMNLLVISYLILSSPFVSIILFIIVLLAFAGKSFAQFRKNILLGWANSISKSPRLQPVLRNIDDTAYVSGT